MNQEQVKQTYLAVIQATVNAIREDFTEKGLDGTTIDNLEVLKARWEARLTQTHEFTDDPLMKAATSTARGGKKGAAASSKSKKKTPKNSKKNNKELAAAAAAAATKPADTKDKNGAIPLVNLTADDAKPSTAPLPAIPRIPTKKDPQVKVETPTINLIDDNDNDGHPAKRARTETGSVTTDLATTATTTKRVQEDDEKLDNIGEDLDSSDDSDVDGAESEDGAENLVLAQHDKVKKGNKWKITLRDGIVSIRGREYLFNKATCDLDF